MEEEGEGLPGASSEPGSFLVDVSPPNQVTSSVPGGGLCVCERDRAESQGGHPEVRKPVPPTSPSSSSPSPPRGFRGSLSTCRERGEGERLHRLGLCLRLFQGGGGPSGAAAPAELRPAPPPRAPRGPLGKGSRRREAATEAETHRSEAPPGFRPHQHRKRPGRRPLGTSGCLASNPRLFLADLDQ